MKPYFETELGAIYYGDCREIMPDLDLKGYALLTDPMYGENQNLQRAYENETTPKREMGGIVLKRKDWIPIKDFEPSDPEPLLIFDQCIIWGGNYFADQLPPSRCWIVWDKVHIPPDDHHDCEMAWTNLGGVTRIHRQLWRGICRQGEENISRGAKLHPFQKPAGLFSFCIDQFKGAPPIIDPFAGACTAGLVCERYQRRWICIEQLEEYCEVGAGRIENERRQLKMFGPEP